MGVVVVRLSLAHNTFWSELYVEPPSERELKFRFVINGKGRPPEEAFATLQLVMKPGQELETGSGRKIVLGSQPMDLKSETIGGSIRCGGGGLRVGPAARVALAPYPRSPHPKAREQTPLRAR